MERYQRVSREVMGARLRAALDEAGLTPTQVAAKLGYTTGGIAHWISGRGEIPSGYLPALAKLTGKSIPYFLGIPEPSSPTPHDIPVPVSSQQTNDFRILGPELAFSHGIGETAASLGLNLEIEVWDYREAVPPDPIADRLGIRANEVALYRARLQTVENRPVRWIASWMPLDLFGTIAEQRPMNRPLFAVLEERTGIGITKVEERLRVVAAQTVGMDSILNVDEREALIAIQRLVHTTVDRVAELAIIYAIPSWWEFAYQYPAGTRMKQPAWRWFTGDPEPVKYTNS